ncbi:MAG: tRNA uridine-5-carboxymethylaminomethyl(34) synthesis GTPase MnmE [Firmicutes bacterium]|nr:tRNA uridine-5-carboxymethylaminomethyl(34) synthesis GTPase MnmE [Bacillota bacterium]
MKTIVAVATPIGIGGVGIVRLSGKEALRIAKEMTHEKGNSPKFKPNVIEMARIAGDGFYDKGMVVYFKSPASFTGEDVVEFNVHGGPVIVDGIVKKALSLGAEMAKAGEFSQRAFVNGKMNLEQAEGLIDMIHSESAIEVSTAYKLLIGEFTEIVNNTQKKLSESYTNLNANIDYPNEDEEYSTAEFVGKEAQAIISELDKILSTYAEGKILKHGFDVSIIGRPNAGKSSLLNALMNENIAIVTDVPGTTRDLVKGTFTYKGVKINLIDTAGITDTEDVVEIIGVEKARQQIEKSDALLYVVDCTVPLTNDDLSLINTLDKKKLILVFNKVDEGKAPELDSLKKFIQVKVSTTHKTNLDELKALIHGKCKVTKPKTEGLIITNARHYACLKETIELLKEAATKWDSLNLDILAEIFRQAYNKLGEITGRTGSEEVINQIFSTFCLGK